MPEFRGPFRHGTRASYVQGCCCADALPAGSIPVRFRHSACKFARLRDAESAQTHNRLTDAGVAS